MSGSIQLSLTQQFDKATSKLLDGGRLYFYAPGTTTPQSAFKDGGLVNPFPNPLTLESDGRVPYLWFADGSIRVRETNSNGVLQFDADNMQVSGTSGGGGGVDTTDPNSIAITGDVKWRASAATMAGWVRGNGRTIGSATSGASERAAADCEALFNYFWNNFPNTICPVTPARGASAAADWTANKQIATLDLRARALVGLDDMGNAAAGRLAGALFLIGDAVTPGGVGGSAIHMLTQANLPNLQITVDIPAGQGQHTHVIDTAGASYLKVGGTQAPAAGSNGSGGGGVPTAQANFLPQMAGLTASLNGAIAQVAQNNEPPFALGTFFIRL